MQVAHDTGLSCHRHYGTKRFLLIFTPQPLNNDAPVTMMQEPTDNFGPTIQDLHNLLVKVAQHYIITEQAWVSLLSPGKAHTYGCGGAQIGG